MNPLDEIHPELARLYCKFRDEVKAALGRSIRITHGLRTIEYQDQLYAQGRTIPGEIVTWASGGYSWHNYGLAVDSCFVGNDPYLENSTDAKDLWNEFGQIAKKNGLEWGGFFLNGKTDFPHIQLTLGLTIHEARSLYDNGGIDAVWDEIDKRLA